MFSAIFWYIDPYDKPESFENNSETEQIGYNYVYRDGRIMKENAQGLMSQKYLDRYFKTCISSEKTDD